MISRGYAGLYLDIDLTRGEATAYPVPTEWHRELIGGKGIGSRILLQETEPGVDPLSPSNILVINTGPFTGSNMPCSSRFNVSTKSPLTLAIASSSCGGRFGHHLKRAGIDGLVIRGRAPRPVHLHLEEGEVTFEDATALWGLDTKKTQEAIGGAASAVIGPAGENGVLFASIISGERAAGRCGTGAVMGSKNLKAITVTGTGRVHPADPEGFKDGVKRLVNNLKKHQVVGEGGSLQSYGTAMLLARTSATNTLPTRNFNRGSFEHADQIDGEALADKVLVKNAGCLTCPIRCERVVRYGEGLIKGPEYETLGLLGSNLEVSDLEAIVEWNHICDLMGMDTISAGVTLGFAMELTDKGLLDSQLRFGSTGNVSETLMDIAYRRGLGDDLAEGTWRMSQKYGGVDFAMHSRGLELASYEPRGAVGHGLGYALSNRGGCHINGGNLVVLEAWGPITVDPLSTRSKPELVALMQALIDAWSAMDLCAFLTFGLLPGGDILKNPTGLRARLGAWLMLRSGPIIPLIMRHPGLLNAVPIPFDMFPYIKLLNLMTGLDFRLGDFLKVGQRTNNQERLFNVREGRAKSADTLPARLTSEPQGEDPGSRVFLSEMLPRAYRAKGWDPEGRPTARTLQKLGLVLYGFRP